MKEIDRLPDRFRSRAHDPVRAGHRSIRCERNPVARRTGVVAGLIADIEGKMTKAAQAPGAHELAAAF